MAGRKAKWAKIWNSVSIQFILRPCMGRALGPSPAQPMTHGPGRVTTSSLTLGWVGPGLSFYWAGPGLGSIAGNVSGHGPGMG